ncbi:MAG: GH36-type glycosyl hydrolase domain-containing protein [Anaerolineae bacterium]
MPEGSYEQAQEQVTGAPEEPITLTIEPTRAIVDALVDNYSSARKRIPIRELNALLQGRDLAGREFKMHEAWLAEAHSYFMEVSNHEANLTFTSEWVLDNYYIVRQALKQIKKDLPPGYYGQLPRLTNGPLKGLPRIYAISRSILSYQQFLLNPTDLRAILVQLQDRILLTVGELWALPIFLRFCLIEGLAHTLATVIHLQKPPRLPVYISPSLVIADPIEDDQPSDTKTNRVVANFFLSLHAVSEQDWGDFFESVSRLERVLRQDPAGIYPLMDFETRDMYRRQIESLSFRTGLEENNLAEMTVELARKRGAPETESTGTPSKLPEPGSAEDNVRGHIGEYLVGKGRSILEDQIGYRPRFKVALGRWLFRHANAVYSSSIMLLTGLLLLLIARIAHLPTLLGTASAAQWIVVVVLALASLVAVLSVAISLVNWLVTLVVKPRILPKMRFKDEIPIPFQTLVVIPAIINSRDEIDSLALQLEMHYLRNPEPGLLYALLTDFRDSDSETQPEDVDYYNYALAAVEKLNAKYKPARMQGTRLFYLLHRKRLWNQSEGKWMGWERKRGKLHELNLLLRGKPNLSFMDFTNEAGSSAALQGVRFVITLDADTILPRGAACRLAGTLAHPLNVARFDAKTGHVVFGYTVLQPRMEINPRSANLSWFTRIFSGDTGLDLYTRAVSNAYHDLFGEGSYVGKGIYDVDAFERSVDRRIPENTVLSHDLLEGIMGRAGLLSDITMIEDYPPNYFVQVLRQRRWTRGDWQLLPWLLQPYKFRMLLSAVDRWKITDNLLRALLAPALVLVFSLGMLSWPVLSGLWLAIPLLSLGIPVFTGMTRGIMQTLGGENIGASFHFLGMSLVRWLLANVFLPYEASSSLGAIFTTLFRIGISHRHLLQWTTAAQTVHLFRTRTRRNAVDLKMAPSVVLALLLAVAIQLIHGLKGSGLAPALAYAIPVLLLWILSPIVAYQINQPIKERKQVPLSEEQIILLRQVARRTWSFFERFVGPEDHWLPPDHFQESPVGITAHHTSPTNIGLLLTSTLAAYDFGYLDQLGLATRLSTTIHTLDQLERFRGHFMNWYDTLTLQPLQPRYISTVDSGNLAASLIIVTQACKTITGAPIFRWELWQGYLDTLSSLTETLTGIRKVEFDQQVEEIKHHIVEMRASILSVQATPERWYSLFQTVYGSFWQDLSGHLVEVVKAGRTALDLEALRKLQEVASQAERHHLAVQRTLDELVPWIPLLEQLPAQFKESRFLEALNALRDSLPSNPRLNQIRLHATAGMLHTAALRKMLVPGLPIPDEEKRPEYQAIAWLDKLDRVLAECLVNTDALINKFSQIAIRTEQYVGEMDFFFLYHPQRRVFHIGFNLDAGQLDNNYYDLLASEARIASIIALAKGEVPQTHWLQLGRPLTQVEGLYVLLSWSATMFEYLMPPLFLRSYSGTLLADSAQGAVRRQIAYGKSKGVPWGISESGFFRFDANQNLQYRAFGVPGLGFKRGLGDDMVVAPYASLMAVRYNPHAVMQNLTKLIGLGSLGVYGFYESIDFTINRMPLGYPFKVVQEYMAHHQGMILLAMANYFHKDIMIERMHTDLRIQSVELLLQEQVPRAVPLQNPYAEDVRGVQRPSAAKVVVDSWGVPVQTVIPQLNLLSNGHYSVVLSNMGAGFSTWRGVDLTRWQSDGVLDPWGTWIYIQDLEHVPAGSSDGGKLWSAGFQPIPGNAANMQVTYSAHTALFRRSENDLTSTMEVTVSPDDPVEIRRLHLHNTCDRPRHLRLTSYGEVILTQQSADTRHPAFNKLFIESEFVPELDLQIFKRRPRSDQENPVYMAHMLVVKGQGEFSSRHNAVHHEADRVRFVGRGRTLRSPAALVSEHYLTGTTGATLDPIFALGQEIELDPHESAELAYLTFAGDSREAILALARRYRMWDLLEQSFNQASIAAQTWLGKENYTTQTLTNTLQVFSALLYPFKEVRALPGVVAANQLSQSGLWRFGISGDYPIILVKLYDPKQLDLVREAIQIHEFLRSRRFMVDVVILNHQQTDYGADLHGMLHSLVSKLDAEQWLSQRGGIFILYADQINPEERTLLQTAGRVILEGERGSLGAQMPVCPVQVHHLPELIPTQAREDSPNLRSEDPLPFTGRLQFSNGYGGFSQDGREYIIDLPHGKPTPAPWINVIGYPDFGFMVSEAGSQSTWAINSGENRLTPWSNDPVSDPTGEALYLRDEETGEVWTPTPLPAGSDRPYRVTHGAGYTIFEHNSHGLRQHITLFASPDDPVKIIRLRVENTWNRPRRITATQYVEWVLGTNHASTMQYIIPEYDPSESCLLATNPYSAEFGKRVAFLSASKPVHGLTADRTEFLGRGGSFAHPAALRRIGLESHITPGEDPCAVLQLHLDLLPGAVEEIYFVLGQGNNKEHALALVKKYCDPANVDAALERTRAFWHNLLKMVQVHTPEPATDLVLNGWLLYQSLSCRIWGRSAFYQPSGAFGFRDQLQDVLALLPIAPAISRSHILNAAKRQFSEGDVTHWWHPPSGRGVRTRISDDLLWLPYVTAKYVEATGDAGILQESIPFLLAPPLKVDENERYSEYAQTQESYSLLEHCHRAIAKGTTKGSQGLPLIGTGDWNDGLNRVGEGGKGESVWLAWFLIDVLNRFAALCEQQGEAKSTQRYRSLAQEYTTAVEQSAWDGDWYRRAYYDDGAPLGSSHDSECQIDAIAQSWAVLSGAGDPVRSRQAMRSVLDRLVRPQDRLSLLFTPPFDKTRHDPGYIKGYLPGTRENGGQYTHAAIWTAWAFTQLGDGKQAGELYSLLNPILQSDTKQRAEKYRVEPYVVCADIYSQPPYLGRGGWTWYTGSASWMYRLGLEAILGLKKISNSLRITPTIPPDWNGFEITYQFGKATYQIKVLNPEHIAHNVQQVTLDGDTLNDGSIPLVDDGREHTVVVTMGAAIKVIANPQ